MRELDEDTAPPSFPPLLRGESVPAATDPLAKAMAAGMKGADPGLVLWSRDETNARVAVLFAPELPLRKAIGGAFAVMLGMADALGALAPPEVAVHFSWPGRFRINGVLCGVLRAAASGSDPEAVPDWLAIAVTIPILPTGTHEPGHTPDVTTLHDEGCGEITAPRLIESFARHMLVWVNRFESEGLAPLHKAWCQKCEEIGTEVKQPEEGLFLGLDEEGGMILRRGDETRIIPLTTLLEGTS